MITLSGTAIGFRSIALFIIMFQLRLIAGGLSDTSVFTAALLAGFGAALFLSAFRPGGKPVNLVSAIVSICLIPWICRALIAMPRLLFANRADSLAIALDSLVLNLDRNNFVSLLPFYWIAVSTWFSVRSRQFMRAAVIADASILLVIYSIARTAKIEIYRWPIVMIVLFAGVVFLQALALLFSMPPGTKLRIKEICFAIAALLAVIVCGGFLFLKPFQEQAVEMGGGLLKPNLFSFDFSRFLKLDSEISMKSDLILIVKKDDDENILLRRSVLSGYGAKQGFYKIEELDERTHPERLPNHRITLSPAEFKAARPEEQEYFLVNFDAAAFIGMKEPVTISPYESWDSSSFKSAYAVTSMVSDANYWDLAGGRNQPGAAEFGFSEKEYSLYTEYGNDARLRTLAEEITRDSSRYIDKVESVYQFLKNGDYRYSLKPGIAPDGDQLGWFLFHVKKGYCSYYAFAMTLLLRSLGIPARLAAGFFVDPETNVFNYYPVRSDMAHAWVEVAFPSYGWIEFDPTSENLAEGEEFSFSAGTDPALFEKLMREILEKRSGLKVKEGAEAIPSDSNSGAFVRNTFALLRNNWPFLFAAILVVVFFYIRCGCYWLVFLARNPRRKSVQLMNHARRRLRLAGLHRKPTLTESEWCLQLEDQFKGIYSMYQNTAAARFAPEYTNSDFDLQRAHYGRFSDAYGKTVPLWRKAVCWILPPLAIALGPGKIKGKALLFAILLAGLAAGSDTGAQTIDDTELDYADALYEMAIDAEYAELWERAIELYRQGEERYPFDTRFSWSLGNLYFNRSLFGLAWDEFLKTESIDPFNPNVLIRLARTAGYLNRDSVSVHYYERALAIDPDNRDAIGSLGWMYFKVHRLADGERLLTSALEQFGDDADFSMTLGTVYSDMFHYDESKYWYTKAITLGEKIGDRVFTAIAWYNLSILESRFYRYDLCMDATNYSLNAQNRASGRLARGELYLHRLELEKAQREYETAYETDTSPLAKLNLAQAYQVSGRLEEARLYAEDCLKNSDHSWMINFGIDPDRYKRDIHQILLNIYSGIVHTERFLPRSGPKEKIRSWVKIITYRFKYEVNVKLYRKYCLASANAYNSEILDGGPHLDSYIQYYNAFEDYPRRAITYLSRARTFETALIPAAVPSYNKEEGILLADEDLIEKAIYGFDQFWEKEDISKCWEEFAKPKKTGLFGFQPQNRNHTRKYAAAELFALNRGALRQSGIRLPVRMVFSLDEETVGLQRRFKNALAAAGFAQDAESRYVLSVKTEGASPLCSVSCELTDSAGEVKTLRHTFPLNSASRADIYGFVRSLGNAVFIIE